MPYRTCSEELSVCTGLGHVILGSGEHLLQGLLGSGYPCLLRIAIYGVVRLGRNDHIFQPYFRGYFGRKLPPGQGFVRVEVSYPWLDQSVAAYLVPISLVHKALQQGR